eukprot:249811_1
MDFNIYSMNPERSKQYDYDIYLVVDLLDGGCTKRDIRMAIAYTKGDGDRAKRLLTLRGKYKEPQMPPQPPIQSIMPHHSPNPIQNQTIYHGNADISTSNDGDHMNFANSSKARYRSNNIREKYGRDNNSEKTYYSSPYHSKKA